MLNDPRPYADYKDSGVPWLGPIPSHWEVRRAKNLYREVDERSASGNEELLSVSHLTGVTPRRQKTVTMFMAESYVGHKVCRPGDLVINTLWAWMAALGVSRHIGLVSPAYGVYRPREVAALEPRYADYLLRTQTYAAEYTRHSTGIRASRLRLYPEAFLKIPVLLPSPDEQRKIVAFLDAHGRKAARFIRNRRRLIELLNEQKQAIITQAVTRGLDPTVPMKASGVPWIGNVPAHWRVSQVRRVVRPDAPVTYGIVQAGPDIEGGVPYIRTGDMAGNTLARDGYLRTSPEIDAAYRRSKVEVGEIVIAIRATVGKCHLVPEFLSGANLTQGTARVAPGAGMLASYLLWFFRGDPVRLRFEELGKGATFQEITLDMLRRLEVLVPTYAEQAEIADALNERCEGLNVPVSVAHQEIALVQEYGQRLVNDVVTGKVDVRQLALAEVEDDPEALELLADGGKGEGDLDAADDGEIAMDEEV